MLVVLFNLIMKTQQTITQNHLKYFIGKKLHVIVDKKINDLLFEWRTEFDAPEIDGIVCFQDANVKVGDMVEVEIIDSLEYDLIGELPEKIYWSKLSLQYLEKSRCFSFQKQVWKTSIPNLDKPPVK